MIYQLFQGFGEAKIGAQLHNFMCWNLTMSKNVRQYAIELTQMFDAFSCIRWRKTPCRRCSIEACRIVSVRPWYLWENWWTREKHDSICFFSQDIDMHFSFFQEWGRDIIHSHYIHMTSLYEHMYGRYYWYYTFHLLTLFLSIECTSEWHWTPSIIKNKKTSYLTPRNP